MSTTVSLELPLVVQLGFAGSRKLYDDSAHPKVNPQEFEDELVRLLAAQIEELRNRFGLTDRHFFCGISQIAVGGDWIFSRVCRDATPPIPQRLFLPQVLKDFLEAHADGDPQNVDFTPEQRKTAAALAEGAIQTRVVSTADNRESRFQDVNFEIARVCDIVVCLERKDAAHKPGGTFNLVAQALARGRPVLLLTLSVVNDRPVLTPSWPTPSEILGEEIATNFVAPEHSEPLAKARVVVCSNTLLPSVGEYRKTMRAAANVWAKKWQWFFKLAAAIIICAHVSATCLAVGAMIAHIHGYKHVEWLLGIEILLLLGGFFMHALLHEWEAVSKWALARLIVQTADSVKEFEGLPIYLEYLFVLPLPSSLRRLLRTLNVLHLRDGEGSADLEKVRERYVHNRLTGPKGQIEYYEKQSHKAHRGWHIANAMFFICSGLAIAASFVKFDRISGHAAHATSGDLLPELLGAAAIILPVLAVAAVSLATAMDYEARERTYSEMIPFLRDRVGPLTHAANKHELAKLMIETEAHLLGETANWYSRRAYIGVS